MEALKKIEETEIRDDTIIKEVKDDPIALNKENKYQNYYINIKDKRFHLVYDEKEKCEELKYVRRKYIQETTANYEEILENKEFSICNRIRKKGIDSENMSILFY